MKHLLAYGYLAFKTVILTLFSFTAHAAACNDIAETNKTLTSCIEKHVDSKDVAYLCEKEIGAVYEHALCGVVEDGSDHSV